MKDHEYTRHSLKNWGKRRP